MEQQELAERRRETGEAILALRETIPSTLLFDRLGRRFRKGSAGYWIANVALLNLIVLGPWLFLGLARDELEATKYLWFSGPITVEFVIAGFLLAHFETRKMLDDLPGLVVARLSDACEVSQFGIWLAQSLSVRSMMPFVGVIWAIWVFLGVAGQSLVHQRFVGIGFSLTVTLEGLLAAIALYMVLWISILAHRLRRYRYELNPFSPASSEILHNIYALIKKRAYAFSLYFAAFMLTSSTSLVDRNSKLVFALPAFAIIWTVMITQYLLTRSTTERIAERGKWIMLNKIAAKLSDLDLNRDLSDRETCERVLRLSEIQRQVQASKAGTPELNSLATLISQLMLPLLGLLLGNIDKVSGLLR